MADTKRIDMGDTVPDVLIGCNEEGAPRPSCLPYLISFLGLRLFLQGLPYQDLTEQCFQLLVHQLNAGFKLLEHSFADMQFFTVIEAPEFP